jgi:pyridinium-3,5-biscarboxylic acid mononucleotide sulfurtransferase
MLTDEIQRLTEWFRKQSSVLVAYSGGVDSSLVMKVAHMTLGDRVKAALAVSPSLPQSELHHARAIAAQIGVVCIELDTHEVDDPAYQANPPNRCYFCKQHVYSSLLEYAALNSFACIVDGMNADDTLDIRPGRKAAKELGIQSPLHLLGITKEQVRTMARELGLPNWDKPAAACLSSRIPYGTQVTPQTLNQIEQAEDILRALGFTEFRVRHHQNLARIEVSPSEFASIVHHQEEITQRLRQIGYHYITLDLEGFRSGSLNEAMRPAAKLSSQ